MNYIIDADSTLIEHGDMNQKFYRWFLRWSKKNTYYLITELSYDDLYASVGKDIIYNAQVVYVESGTKVYVQSCLVESDETASAKDYLPKVLEAPLTYYGNNVPFGHTITAAGHTFCRVRNWKEAWDHLKEEELCV